MLPVQTAVLAVLPAYILRKPGHDLLLKAVAHHTDERWVLLYIERWLKAPVQMPDGTLVAREKGTPQGSPISRPVQVVTATAES